MPFVVELVLNGRKNKMTLFLRAVLLGIRDSVLLNI